MLSQCLMTTMLVTICQVCEGASKSPGYCVDHGYTPEHGYRKPSAAIGYKFFNGSVIRYFCDPSYTMNASSTIQTCVSSKRKDYRWEPEVLPTCSQVQEKRCPLPEKIEHGTIGIDHLLTYTTLEPGTRIYYFCDPNYHLVPKYMLHRECHDGKWSGSNPRCVSNDQMPSVPSDDFHCTLPQPSILNGQIKCCLESSANQANSTKDPSYCCPGRGLVEFTCNDGYTLKGAPNQWICGTYGDWLSLDSDMHGAPNETPKCFSNDTREEATPFGDITLKQVFGVSAGVLVILSAVIIFALCRPKLINMKRRWRELRDDEDELIIDGRRIVLPSYEEATTSRDLYFLEESCSSSQSDNIPRISIAERQSNISESRTESSVVSTSTASTNLDENLLDVETSSATSNNDVGVDSNVQSLILTAGTSLNVSVMINSPPRDICQESDLASEIEGAADAVERGRRNSDDDAMLVLDSDSECNLDTIYPSNSASLVSSVNQRPTCTDSDHNLLSYPLRPVDYANDNFLQPQSFSVIIGSSDIHDQCEDDQGMKRGVFEPASGENEAVQNCDEPEDPCGPLVESTDQMHMKLSSPTTKQETENLGSTVV